MPDAPAPLSLSAASARGDRASVALWHGGGDVEVTHQPLPWPGPGEAVVAVTCTTACGCVRRVVEERRFGGAPTVLGHEGVGRLLAVGAGVADVNGAPLAEGDRVVWLARTSCGECRRCRAGDRSACSGAREIGAEPVADEWTLPGSFASHLQLPRGAALARVPDWAPDALVSPAGCAVARAVAAVERIGSLAGKRVMVVGAGLIGLAVTALAAESGAASCVVVEERSQRRARALAFGADVALDPGARLPACDVAVVASGAADSLAPTVGALATGGSVAVLGPLEAGVAACDGTRIAKEGLTVTGVAGTEPRHLAQAVDLLVSTHAVRPWTELVAAPVPLARAAAVMMDGGAGDRRGAVAPA
ncbi:alcohol dehydrogenase catalytic domain-containing protein [Demequina sp. NBRC 110056]|uniref:alcohol dehydrogenase catalytic domain-containing protein n=1 Tax=Demequina sp. NBRC 110056 TaxID=1570345 RepID=UPI000A00D36F|nr:alcohol dehydrogenase catalytic domain-containing protein [Demequina sp. NBRC 110056]